MNGNDKTDFLDQMMQSAPPVEPSEADDSPESDVETGVSDAPEVVADVPPQPTPTEATPAPESSKTVPIAALMSEREKRQKLEKELEGLRAQPKESAPKANFYDDPEQYVTQAVDRVRAEANERVYVALEAVERDAHTDYDEVTTEVIEAAKSDPILAQTIAKAVSTAANPAREMYKQGQRLREMKELQDPEAFKARVREELKAELLAEFGQRGEQATREAQARAAKAAAIPPDISNRGSATPKAPVLAENPVDSLFPK